MHRSASKVIYVLLSVMMVTTILAVPTQAASDIVTPTHRALVVVDQGQGMPPGAWSKAIEPTRLYLHRDSEKANFQAVIQEALATTAGALDGVPHASNPPLTAAAPDSPYYLDYEQPLAGLTYVKTPAAGPAGSSAVTPDRNDPNNKQVEIGPLSQNYEAFWLLPDSLSFTVDTIVYGMAAQIYATCSGNTDDRTNYLGIALQRYTKQGDGSWSRDDFNGGNSGGTGFPTAATEITGSTFTATTLVPTGAYVGSTAWGNSELETGGVLYEAGKHRLGFSIMHSPVLDGSCFIHFDSQDYNSNVVIYSASARLNTWAENLEGSYVFGIPSAASTDADRRKFQTQVMHVSSWPQLNAYRNEDLVLVGRTEADRNNQNDNLCQPVDTRGDPAVFYDDYELFPCGSSQEGVPVPAESGPPVNYQDDFWDLTDARAHGPDGDREPHNIVAAGNLRIRLRDLVSFNIVSGTANTNIQEIGRSMMPVGEGTSVNRITHTWFYPASLPDRAYRSEAYSESGGIAVSPEFVAGLKGIQIKLLPLYADATPATSALHTVNPGEPTEFRFQVTNIGAEDDTVTVVPSVPGNNWIAEIESARQTLKGNGGVAEFVLRVVPPITATPGSSQAITVTASSADFPLEVKAVTQTVTVRVSTTVSHAVNLDSATTTLNTAPGETTTVGGVRVTNLGSEEDTYVFAPSVPSGISGWTFSILPPSKSIFAQSSEDLQVQVKAPVTATPGSEFTLTLKATRLGDATKTDDVKILVKIIGDHGFLAEAGDVLTLQPATATVPPVHWMDMRETDYCRNPDAQGQLCVSNMNKNPPQYPDTRGYPPADNDDDPSAFFRIELTNPTAVDDVFRVTRHFVTPGDTNGAVRLPGINVDGLAPGICKWRAEAFPSTVAVPAGETVVLYQELAYSAPSGVPPIPLLESACTKIPSRAVAYRMIFRSTNDLGEEETLIFGAKLLDSGARQGAGRYASAVRGVDIMADLTQPDLLVKTQPSTAAGHLLRVTNTGNELDTLVIQVNPTAPGWTRSLEFVSAQPPTAVCTSVRTDNSRWECQNMGIHDEALFRLVHTPLDSVGLGQSDSPDVQVVSGDDGRFTDTIQVTTQVTGAFLFAARELDTTREGAVGTIVTLPFEITNIGTEGDSYTISTLLGDDNYDPAISLADESFIPAGSSVVGLATVTIPAGSTVGAAKLFRFEVRSSDGEQVDNLDYTVTTQAPKALTVVGDPNPEFVIAERGVPQTVKAKITDAGTGGAGRVVTVTRDVATVPTGWTVTPATQQVTLANAGTVASGVATFTVTAPEDALGTSRVPLRVVATSTAPTPADGFGDLFLVMSEDFGLKLEVNGSDNQTIVPGGEVVYKAVVTNEGLSRDTVVLSNSKPTTGWTVQYSPSELTLDPLESQEVDIIVGAPSNAPAGAETVVQMLATSRGGSLVARLTLETTVGFYTLALETPSEVPHLAPEESAVVVFNLTNTGTLQDKVAVEFEVPSGFAPYVTVRVIPSTNVTEDEIVLDAGESKSIAVEWLLTSYVPSDVNVNVPVTFRSSLDPVGTDTQPSGVIQLYIIRNLAFDVDNDGIKELLIDRDENATNGYDEFREPDISAGRNITVALDPSVLMGPDARERYTVEFPGANNTTFEYVDYLFDGDGEGRRDWLMDTDADGVPDLYWDPDRGAGRTIPVAKDVTGDGHVEYFIDLDGLGGFHLDAFYDAWEAEWGDLIEVDIDSDGNFDYIVDLNSNGRVDLDEPVLYGGPNGEIIKITEKRDVDGDGKLDTVVDTDGDGVPDYFIPNGKTTGIPLVMEDVNGDGIDDWTYDSNGDGTRDSYYDPVANQVGRISPGNAFLQDLKDYYYIPVLFALVLVLFVVLVAVTRK